jgi:tetratricopeptide (TPR) repeat protein
VKLQNLVATHPDDPTYHFLLARLYANGRYYEEAFAEYKKVLALDPRAYEAYVNIGNIQFRLGQYGEAVVQYRRAIENRPSDVLAYYNAYVTHSDWFRFKEAQEYLEKGNALAPDRMAQLLNEAGRAGGRVTVVDAAVDLDQVWLAAMEGKPLRGIAPVETSGGTVGVHLRTLLNPWSFVCMLALTGCLLTLPRKRSRAPARLCQRCGRPYCSLCKTERDKGRDYCSQCVHLFVLCDGLAAETKTRKLYEVERYLRIRRTTRRIASWLLPGGGPILDGRPLRGLLLLWIWVVALLACAPGVLVPIARLSGFDVHLGRVRPTLAPAFVAVDVVALLGVAIAVVAWAASNLRIPGRREA